ncbi:hypothetical protein HK096_002186 [Nowakowskiella sp. JEL0078]|nr:hypothetical protein HK096_002186 [Nowakowskiella sp. JEL0078]
MLFAGSYPPGTLLKVNSHSVIIERFLAEGGFAHVYLVQILGSNPCVLKRLLCPDDKSKAEYSKEVEIMKAINGHKNIVQYYDSCISAISGGGFEILILMEFCERGHLVDYLNSRLSNRLSELEVLTIFSDICEAVGHMHYGIGFPIVHRDIKVENVLLMANGSFKLCDFGSATTRIIPPRTPLSVIEIHELENEINRFTTSQYRAPELLDLYQKMGMCDKVDTWALGILLYKLCYFITPFEESGKLAALNSRFVFPDYPSYSPALKSLISMILNPNPLNRPNVYDIAVIVSSMRGVLCPMKPPPLEFTSQSLPQRVEISPLLTISNQYSGPNQFSASVADQASNITPMRRGRPTPKNSNLQQTINYNMNGVINSFLNQSGDNVKASSQDVLSSFDPLSSQYQPTLSNPRNFNQQQSSFNALTQTISSHVTTPQFTVNQTPMYSASLLNTGNDPFIVQQAKTGPATLSTNFQTQSSSDAFRFANTGSNYGAVSPTSFTPTMNFNSPQFRPALVSNIIVPNTGTYQPGNEAGWNFVGLSVPEKPPRKDSNLGRGDAFVQSLLNK